MTAPVTQQQLAAILRPFVGAKLSRAPRTTAVDILGQINSINADVRAVTDAGVERFSCHQLELMPWHTIRRVTVRSIDRDGNTTSQAVYELRQMKAAA